MADFQPVEFYRSLIKSSFTLGVRNQLGDLLSLSVRNKSPEKWTKIVQQKSFYSNNLSHLSQSGYLKVKLPYGPQLARELCSLPHSGNGQKGSGGRTETEPLAGVQQLPLVQRLISDPSLYSLVSLYLGAPAHLHTCQAWWQYPMGPDHKPSNAQLWHRDRDDLSEVKLFFYATNVDARSGPHSFIPCSHTLHGLESIFPKHSLDNEIINGSLNSFVDDSFFDDHGLKGTFKVWLGPAGTCFLEDTRGFHRARIPSDQPRLILSLVWTVGPGF